MPSSRTASAGVSDPLWTRTEGVNWRAIEGDEGILLHLSTGDYYSLNPVGLRIWELIDGRRRASAITGALAGTFGKPEQALAKDVLAFGEALMRENLIQTATTSAGRNPR